MSKIWAANVDQIINDFQTKTKKQPDYKMFFLFNIVDPVKLRLVLFFIFNIVNSAVLFLILLTVVSFCNTIVPWCWRGFPLNPSVPSAVNLEGFHLNLSVP